MESGDQARQLFRDLARGIRDRAWQEYGTMDRTTDSPSPMKAMYGDVWSFVHGVNGGIDLMQEDMSGREWEEAMDEYGYGAHGTGLEAGRGLAFWEPDQFDFTEDEDDDEGRTFTFEP